MLPRNSINPLLDDFNSLLNKFYIVKSRQIKNTFYKEPDIPSVSIEEYPSFS